MRCPDCPLGGPQCAAAGPSTAALAIVGEAPGAQEVRTGIPFVGPAGRLLDATLAEHGLHRSDCLVTNVVACRPTDAAGKDKPPNQQMIAACRGRLREEILSRFPRLIVAVGATAARATTGINRPIGELAGALQWVDAFNAWVLPTYHPAAVLRGQYDYYEDIWESFGRASDLLSGRVPWPAKTHELNWRLIQDSLEANKILYQWNATVGLGQRLELSLDTESSGIRDRQPRFTRDHWDLLQIFDGYDAYAFHVDSTLITANSENRLLLYRLFRSELVTWFLHNLTYDFQVLQYHLGRVPRVAYDTMVLGLGLTERGRAVGLEAMARKWCGAPYYEPGVDFATGPRTDAEWLAFAKYGCQDAYYTWKLAKFLPERVRAEGTLPLCRDLLLPAQKAFARMEFRGIAVDLDYAHRLEAQWVPIIEEEERELQKYARKEGFPADPTVVGRQRACEPCPVCVGVWELDKMPTGPRTTWRAQLAATDFGDPPCATCSRRRYVLVPDDTLNVRSAPQLHHLAHDVLGLAPVAQDWREPGRRGVDKAFFEEYAGHEFVQRLSELRRKDKLLSTYVRGIVDDVWDDGRIHPDFLLFATSTGRLVIKNPPLQTLPKWGTDPELARMIRRMFVSSPGHTIVAADYAMLELFIAWHYSGDANLGRALTERDFHRATASAIFGVPYDQVTKLQRQQSKPVSFGVGFGRGAAALARGELAELTGGDVWKAQRFIDRFWAEYPAWHRQYLAWRRQALETGEVTNSLGRKRRWRLITPDNEEEIARQASNFPIQSLASDTCLSAMVRLEKRLVAESLGHVLFTVHDEIVCEIPETKLSDGVKVIVDEMTSPPYPTHVQFAVEVSTGPNLGDQDEWKG